MPLGPKKTQLEQKYEYWHVPTLSYILAITPIIWAMLEAQGRSFVQKAFALRKRKTCVLCFNGNNDWVSHVALVICQRLAVGNTATDKL